MNPLSVILANMKREAPDEYERLMAILGIGRNRIELS